MTKAYLFDMDGVIVDNCGYHTIAWLELAKRHGGHLTERQVIDWMGAPARDYITRMFDTPPSPAEVATLVKEKESLYRELYRPHLAAREGLKTLLERAKSSGIRCAVVTGGSPDNVRYVMDGTGLHPYFDCVVDAASYQRGKPAPDCYLQAAARLGIAPQDCIVFEDALSGIQAAQSANMRVIAIVGTNPRSVLASAHPTRIIDSFTEFLNS